MLGSPCFQHPRGIEINTFWTNRKLDVPIVISQFRNKKGWIAINDCIFPLEDPKLESALVFQALIAAAFCANPDPWPCPFIDISWHGLVTCSSWSLMFTSFHRQWLCLQTKQINIWPHTLGKASAHTKWRFIGKRQVFYTGTVVLIKST